MGATQNKIKLLWQKKFVAAENWQNIPLNTGKKYCPESLRYVTMLKFDWKNLTGKVKNEGIYSLKMVRKLIPSIKITKRQ